MFYLRYSFCLWSRNQHFQVIFSLFPALEFWFSDLFLFSRYNLIYPSKESLLLHSQISPEGGLCKNVMWESLGGSLPLTCTDWHPLGHSLSVSNPLADILMLRNPPRSGTSCSLSPPLPSAGNQWAWLLALAVNPAPSSKIEYWKKVPLLSDPWSSCHSVVWQFVCLGCL